MKKQKDKIINKHDSVTRHYEQYDLVFIDKDEIKKKLYLNK